MLNQMATLTKGVWFLRDKNKDCGWEGAQQELGPSKETAPGRNVRVEVLPVVFLLLFACLPPTYRWSLGHGLCLQQLAGWSLTRRRVSKKNTTHWQDSIRTRGFTGTAALPLAPHPRPARRRHGLGGAPSRYPSVPRRPPRVPRAPAQRPRPPLPAPSPRGAAARPAPRAGPSQNKLCFDYVRKIFTAELKAPEHAPGRGPGRPEGTGGEGSPVPPPPEALPCPPPGTERPRPAARPATAAPRPRHAPPLTWPPRGRGPCL